ncbi:hypothetical protein Ddc_15683 [Ditylenchus destructor]|nr:hypothetical protein Ddc_15683 [Ditylenchus destructor]
MKTIDTGFGPIPDVETKLEELQVNKYTIVAFDTVMQEEQSTEWFKNRGFTLDAPVDIPPENALLDSHEWTQNLDSNINISILGSAQEKIPLSEEEKRFPWFYPGVGAFRKPVLYYAQFNPVLNQYSWDYLAQFLKLLYHPTSYVKEVDMYAVNQSFIDSLKCNVNNVDNKPRYIQYANVVHLPDMFKWTIQNVRAETIHIFFYCDSENFALLSNFVFDASGAKQCASKEIQIPTCPDRTHIIRSLIEKFHTIPLVESAIPTLSCYMDREELEELPAHLGPNLIAQEVDSEGADALYMISNGENRMRIMFRWNLITYGLTFAESAFIQSN